LLRNNTILRTKNQKPPLAKSRRFLIK